MRQHVIAGLALVGALAVACDRQETSGRAGGTIGSDDTNERARIAHRSDAPWSDKGWMPPDVASLKDDSLGRSIRRGLALIEATADSLPSHVPSGMRCTSCHLDRGTRTTSAPISGVAARFPKYLERAGGVVTLQERVNFCFTRSLAGRAIDVGGHDMRDIIAYLTFISTGVPVGAHLSSEGLPKMPKLRGDTAAGRALYASTCARCHGNDGAGAGPVPALWGAHSFSIGASMAREERAASFIRHNMPFDRPGTLTDQQAFDVAAFVTSHPRPDSPEKATDWPTGGAPYDVPYDTKGHTAYHPPALLPRLAPRASDRGTRE